MRERSGPSQTSIFSSAFQKIASTESCSIADSWGFQPSLHLSSTRKTALTIIHLPLSTTASNQSLRYSSALLTGSLLILGWLLCLFGASYFAGLFHNLSISLMKASFFSKSMFIHLILQLSFFNISVVKLLFSIPIFRHNSFISHPRGMASCMCRFTVTSHSVIK